MTSQLTLENNEINLQPNNSEDTSSIFQSYSMNNFLGKAISVAHFPIKSNSKFRKLQQYIEDLTKHCDCSYMKNVCLHVYRSQRHIIIPFIWGILVGIAFTTLVFQQRVLMESHLPFDESKLTFNKGFKPSSMNLDRRKNLFVKEQLFAKSTANDVNHESKKEFSTDLIAGFTEKNRIFVGVITAEKFLSTRALAVNNTWGSQVDKIEFFAQHGSREKYGIPVVNLDHISDTEYPPQRKAFEMLKYMCSHHLDDFEWFIRADDDVYIRVEKLKKFLSQIDADKMIYMGQPGHGVREMVGRLGLNGHNFCMGGPGVIFNRRAMKALCPHIDDCIAGVVSKEEDVEIGRCVTKYLHIECTHAWEALKLFYHSYREEYNEEHPFLGILKENIHVGRAITLHHLKLPLIMYRVHRHYNVVDLAESDKEINNLKIRINNGLQKRSDDYEDTSIMKKRGPNRGDWKTFSTESVHTLSPQVVHDITNDVLADLRQVCEFAIDLVLDDAQVQKATFSHVIDGAARSNYLDGTEYDVNMSFQSKSQHQKKMIKRIQLFRPVRAFEASMVTKSTVTGTKTMFVIVAVSSSKSAEFETFMRHFYEPVFLIKERLMQARLIVVVTDHHTDSNIIQNWSLSPSVDEILSQYRDKYPGAVLEVLPRFESQGHNAQFSMQLGFAKGILHVQANLKTAKTFNSKDVSVLLTTTNITLSPDVANVCSLRTSFSGVTDIRLSNYNFANYKARKKKDSNFLPHLYQPIPFHVYPAALVGPWPTALVPQSTGLKPGLGGVPLSMVKSSFGFWNTAAGTNEEEEVIAPLCGSLIDFEKPLNEVLKSSNASQSDLNFKDVLYQAIYAGKLDIMRVPDRSYSTVPKR